MKDRNDKKITDGSVINIHQTVNGRSLFVVLKIEPLDVRYAFDLTYHYEYDQKALLDIYVPEKEIEIVGNIYAFLNMNLNPSLRSDNPPPT